MSLISVSRRQILATSLAAAWTGLFPRAAFAQSSWTPERTVEVVLGVGPGGATDRTAREIADFLQKGGFTPKGNVVSNKPGGGHAVALAYTISKAGDPHIIQVTGHVIIANNVLGRSPLSYKDVTPIATLFDEQMVFATGANSGIESAQDLIDKLKDDPASVSFSISTGVGTTNHISVLLLAEQIGIDPAKVKVVSFNSSTEGVTATIGGHIDVAVTTPFALNPYVESGDLRYIAAAAETRVGGIMADVPTWKELGYDIVVSSSPKIVAPPDLTPEQIAYWENAFATITKTPEWKAMIEKNHLIDRVLNAEESRAQFDADDARYRKLLSPIIPK
ncbi:putative tricarboxylic transport membrane protein [Aureimonas altamirensis DSM 21988]|uniref:Tricarboxylic transport membrane protein n=1 Tax=Aureimonas altamirensis DSM 21988 TaxID=1121026 RepID=A0ABY1IPM1_9HYPH|nr:tripartite tricarboxylate transporter substrate binding protein [Aureimonas altamirensis]SHJ78723.1 putative tricarboxylic transport membrane protein [Aureimonas altamirensis DSM 21988]